MNAAITNALERGWFACAFARERRRRVKRDAESRVLASALLVARYGLRSAGARRTPRSQGRRPGRDQQRAVLGLEPVTVSAEVEGAKLFACLSDQITFADQDLIGVPRHRLAGRPVAPADHGATCPERSKGEVLEAQNLLHDGSWRGRPHGGETNLASAPVNERIRRSASTGRHRATCTGLRSARELRSFRR
jgi:hypothetical protein